MNQTNPIPANSKLENKYHVEGLHFQPKGKNVLQGVMNAFNSNEGMGVSIRQNVIQEREDMYNTIHGTSFGRIPDNNLDMRATNLRMKSYPKAKHMVMNRS